MKTVTPDWKHWLATGLIVLLGVASLPAQTPPASAPYAWHSVTIVAGGYVPGIIFSPAQKDLYFCRTDIGGGYRWDTVAKQWVPLTDYFGPTDGNYLGCESIAPDPHDPNKLYIAVGMYQGGRAAILRSNDGGKTFQITEVPFKMGGNEIGRGIGERLAVDPNDTKVLYFGSRHDGLWRSEDAAVTWSKVDSFPFPGAGSASGARNGNTSAGVAFVIFDSHDAKPGEPTNSLYVGVAEAGDAHLFHSADAGKTWNAVAGQPADLLPQHGALDADGMLYLTYGSSVGPNDIQSGAVWKLDTKSGAWTNITPALSRSGGGFSGLSLDAQHPGTLVVSTLDHWNPSDDILRSTDGGKTWKSVNTSVQLDDALSPYLHWGRDTIRFGWWITALAIDPFDSNHVLYGTGATIWGAHDFTNLDQGQPTHWTVAAAGIEETAVLDLISPPAGPHLISAVGDIGGFRHDDLATSPPTGMSKSPVFTNTYSLDFAELKPAVVVRTGNVSSGPAFSYSKDGGATWQPLNVPGAAGGGGRRGGGGGAGRDTVVVSADGGTFLCSRGPAISTDRGQTWTPSAGLRAGLRPVADRANTKKFYALDTANGALWVSADGGATFTSPAVTGLPAGGGRGARGGGGGGGARLLATPGKEGDLWVVDNRRLYHSSDGGANFMAVSADASIYAFGFGMAPPGENYPALFMTGNVGNAPGIYRSDDVGASWIRINDDQHQYGNYPTVVIGDPRVFGRVYIGTNGRGIFYADPVTAK